LSGWRWTEGKRVSTISPSQKIIRRNKLTKASKEGIDVDPLVEARNILIEGRAQGTERDDLKKLLDRMNRREMEETGQWLTVLDEDGKKVKRVQVLRGGQ
jgi:hypothetical protein